jgi:putative transposase
MKKWHTAKDLAGLNGMPKTVQGVTYKAKNDHYIARFKRGRGGGHEFHLTSLPDVTKDHLHKLQMEAETLPVPSAMGEVAVVEEEFNADLTGLKGWQREVFHARLILYREFQRLQGLYGTTKAWKKLVAMAEFEELPEHYQELVPIANARRGKSGRTLSKSTILGWQRKVKEQGLTGLAPKSVEKKTIPVWAPSFIKCYGTPDKPSIPQAMERMVHILPEAIKMPSYEQVYRFHSKRSRLDREIGRRTGSDLKALKGYRKRDTSDLLPMEVGTCDGHSFKSRVANPRNGNPFKPEICSVVDVATRVLVGWSVGLAESAETVGGALRHAATVNEQKPFGGVFSIFYTDGGSGNKAKVLTDDFAGVFARIGTEHKTGIPGNAQGRGLIERLNSSLWIPAAKELPTFVGKDMDGLTERNLTLLINREIKKNGKSEYLPTWPQFIAHCQQSVDKYNRRPHRSLPKINDPETGRRRHMAPLEMWAWHMSKGWKPEECQLTEAEIELLFLPRQKCKVIRSSVTLWTNTYFNKALEHYAGKSVQVGYDIHDPAKVQIWDKDNRMICHAFFEKNRTSYFARSVVDQASEQRAKRRRQIKIDQIAEIDAEEKGFVELEKSNVIELKPTTIKADKEALILEMEAKSVAFIVPTDDKAKYQLWNELETRLDQTESLTEKEMKFYEAYRKSASYRAFKSVAEDLGQQM